MAKRHNTALYMQHGACNPSGIAHAFVDACKEVRDEGGDVRKDPALRLIAHQLAYLMQTGELDDTMASYRSLMEECYEKADDAGIKEQFRWADRTRPDGDERGTADAEEAGG